jgi:hypothetical protein
LDRFSWQQLDGHGGEECGRQQAGREQGGAGGPADLPGRGTDLVGHDHEGEGGGLHQAGQLARRLPIRRA